MYHLEVISTQALKSCTPSQIGLRPNGLQLPWRAPYGAGCARPKVCPRTAQGSAAAPLLPYGEQFPLPAG